MKQELLPMEPGSSPSTERLLEKPVRRLTPLIWVMLVVGVIFLIYSPLYQRDPTHDDFGAPPAIVAANPEGHVSTVMLITGISLLAGAGVLLALNKQDWRAVTVLLVVALVIRLAFAFGFFGSADVNTYYNWPDYLRGGNIYRTFEVYHWPPPLIFVITGLDWLARLTGIPLYGLAALPPILADLATGVLIYRFAADEGLPDQRRVAVSALYLLNPVSILVSAMHIQFGSVYVLPVLLAAYLLVYLDSPHWSAFWLGVGLATMLIPMLFIPAFLAQLPSWRKRLVFLVLCGLPLLVVSAPYLVQNPWLVTSGYLGYRSEYGIWGSSYLLSEFTNNVWGGPGEGFRGYARAYGSYGLLLTYIVLGFTAFRRMKLINALALTMLIFYLNPTGFATQYVILLLPFVVLEFEQRTGLWYTILGSLFAVTVYTGVYFYPWLNQILPTWPNPTRLFSLPVWAWCVWEVGRRLWGYLRALQWPLARSATG
jgi:hypothetical protein